MNTLISDITGITILLVCIVLSSFIIFLKVKKKLPSIYAFPSLILLIHSIIFYISLFIEKINGTYYAGAFTTWSSALRLHGYVTMFFLIIMLLDAYNQSGRKL